jgi:hypothetical protein
MQLNRRHARARPPIRTKAPLYETERPGTFSAGQLFQLSGNASERRRQIGAEGVYGSNDSDRDAGRDKTIFDGGRPAIVLQEASHKLVH